MIVEAAPNNIPFQNSTEETIPGFAVMQLKKSGDEVVKYAGGQAVLQLEKPDSSISRFFYINGPQAVKAKGYGNCTMGLHDFALWVGSVDDIKPRLECGAVKNEWGLKPGYPGFIVLGKPEASEDEESEPAKLVLVRQHEPQIITGKLTQRVKRSSSDPASGKGKFKLWGYGSPFDDTASLSEGEDEIDCFCDWIVTESQGYGVGAEVYLIFVNGRWKVLGPCPSTQG